jgi:predicted ester cyclase
MSEQEDLPMANHNARSIVYHYFEEVWNQRKLEAIHDLLDPAFVGHERNADDVIGPSGVHSVANTFFQNFPNATFTVIKAVAEENMVAVHLCFEAVHHNTRRPVTVSGMIFVQLREGKIVETWSNWDEYGMFRQIGGTFVFDE